MDDKFREDTWKKIQILSNRVQRLGGIVQNDVGIKGEQLEEWYDQVTEIAVDLDKIRKGIIVEYYAERGRGDWDG